ncbi:hypothetical protein [Glycomyces arizonensis]|uniref:hypothetical protein n=1 Tax=Glycomyces arizonensis TaxID=256035 RepID=UPI0012EB680E|nr:hypothetical protein [Glycomyces arizonensis]
MPRNSVMHRGDLVYRIEQLERLLIDRTSGRSLENSSIGAGGLDILDEGNINIEGGDLNLNKGGSLTINGGELRSVSPNGETIFYTGPRDIGDDSYRIWELGYDNGVRAVSTAGTFGSETIRIQDYNGNVVFSTASAAGGIENVGLAKPHIPLVFYPTFEAENGGSGPGSCFPTTTNSAFTPLLTCTATIWAGRIRISVHTGTAGGGNCEWRLLVDGSPATDTISGTGTEFLDVPGWGNDIRPGFSVDLVVEARCADGAERAYCNIDHAWAFSG